MFKFKRFLANFFVIFLIFLNPSVTLAVDLNLPNVSITPEKGILYSVKRLTEKALEFTKLGKGSKADYYQYLTLLRMSELNYVVKNKFLGEIENSTQRLSYQIGILTDYINANEKDLADKKQSVTKLFLSYRDSLKLLRDNYSANSSFWLLVQHSINSIDLNLEKFK